MILFTIYTGYLPQPLSRKHILTPTKMITTTAPIPESSTNHQNRSRNHDLRRMQRNINCVTKTRKVLTHLNMLDQNRHKYPSVLALEQAGEEAEKYLTVCIEKMYGRKEEGKRLAEKIHHDGRFNEASQYVLSCAEAANAAIFGSKASNKRNDRQSKQKPVVKNNDPDLKCEQESHEVEDEEITHKDRLLQSLERRRKYIAEMNRAEEPGVIDGQRKIANPSLHRNWTNFSRRNRSSRRSPVGFQTDNTKLNDLERSLIMLRKFPYRIKAEDNSHFAGEDEVVHRLEVKEAYRKSIQILENNDKLQ